MNGDLRLVPLLVVVLIVALFYIGRRVRRAARARRLKRLAAEEREQQRIAAWIKRIRPAGAGPAVTRDRDGVLVLNKGLRRIILGYAGQHRQK